MKIDSAYDNETAIHVTDFRAQDNTIHIAYEGYEDFYSTRVKLDELFWMLRAYTGRDVTFTSGDIYLLSERHHKRAGELLDERYAPKEVWTTPLWATLEIGDYVKAINDDQTIYGTVDSKMHIQRANGFELRVSIEVDKLVANNGNTTSRAGMGVLTNVNFNSLEVRRDAR